MRLFQLSRVEKLGKSLTIVNDIFMENEEFNSPSIL